MRAYVIGGGAMVVETTPLLVEYLHEDGFEVSVSETAADLTSSAFKDCDLLVINSCLFTAIGHTIELEARLAFANHFEQGKGVVVMHSSIGNWDDWPEYIDYIGGIWKWGGLSKHSAADSVFTIVKVEDHPLLEGVPDSYDVIDEMYYDLEFTTDNKVIASTSETFGSHPMVWYRQSVNSRVAAIMIGHDERAVQHPQYKQLFRNACKWTRGEKTNDKV